MVVAMSEDHDRHPVGRRAAVRDKTARATLPGRGPGGRGRPNRNTLPGTVRRMTALRFRETSTPGSWRPMSGAN